MSILPRSSGYYASTKKTPAINLEASMEVLLVAFTCKLWTSDNKHAHSKHFALLTATHPLLSLGEPLVDCGKVKCNK